MMIMLCQWDFNELIEKLVRFLLYTSEICSRKFHACVVYVLYPVRKRRVKSAGSGKRCFFSTLRKKVSPLTHLQGGWIRFLWMMKRVRGEKALNFEGIFPHNGCRGIGTRCRLEGTEFELRLDARDFFFSTTFQTDPGTHIASYAISK
jgi:hypothetical protein